MVIDFYDTSALLKNPSAICEGDYVSHYVISEIEEIKTSSHKDEKVKANARQVSRGLLANPVFICDNFSEKEILRMMRKHPYLPDNTDGRLIAEALLVAKKHNTNIAFHTADINMMLFVIDLPNFYLYIEKDEEEIAKELWAGWGKYFPDDKQMAMLYTDPRVNILGAKINEYCEIFSGEELKDILRWDGEMYRSLKYSNFRTALMGNISPRNLEQKMLFDMLQNKDETIKLCLGRFGSGKSMLMLAHAIWMVQRGEFEKIVFVKNNIQVKDTKDIGSLPGTMLEKLQPYLQQIADHIGGYGLDEMLEQEMIEPVHLGFIRGRDIKNSIIYCDEVENMTSQHIQLLIGRVSQGSQLWLAGDTKQCDSLTFEKNSGIKKLTDRLAGNPKFGCVKLMKSERSETAALADLLD